MAHTKMPFRKVLCSLSIIGLMVLAPMQIATAACATGQQSCSSHYSVTESFFGSGGELHACSTGQYCAKQSAGELTVGNTCTLTYCAQAGFNTNRQEYIEFIVNGAAIDMGTLSDSTTHVGTATFSVKTYLSDGYQVTNASPPPVNGTHYMTTSGTAGPSTVGTEQFGINLVANTCPATAPALPIAGGCTTPGSSTLGADKVQVPDNTFSFGDAASGYNTADNYKYGNGDQVAYSSKSSGETDYTITYIMNINQLTPAGTYTMNHVLVATSTF